MQKHNQMSNTAKTLCALQILTRQALDNDKDAKDWDAITRSVVPGWSFINCIQWLTGKKAETSLQSISDAQLQSFGLDQVKVSALVEIAHKYTTTYGKAPYKLGS